MLIKQKKNEYLLIRKKIRRSLKSDFSLLNEKNKCLYPDISRMKNILSLLKNKQIEEKLKKISINNVQPIGSFLMGSLRNNKKEIDIIMHLQKTSFKI